MPQASLPTRPPAARRFDTGPTGVLERLPAANRATLTGKEFFPHLMAAPFHAGLVIVDTAD